MRKVRKQLLYECMTTLDTLIAEYSECNVLASVLGVVDRRAGARRMGFCRGAPRRNLARA